MDAAQITKRPPVDTKTLDAVASMRNMAAAQTKSHQQLDRNSKDAHATHINLDAAQTVLPFKRAHIAKVATAHTLNSNAVRTALQRLKVKTLKAVLAQIAALAAAQMVLPKHKARTLMAVKRFQAFHKRRAALTRIRVIAATMQSNTSLTWNMAVAHASGIVAVAVMIIALNRSKIVRERAKRLRVATHAYCQRFMDHALHTSNDIITIRIVINVWLSVMVAA